MAAACSFGGRRDRAGEDEEARECGGTSSEGAAVVGHRRRLSLHFVSFLLGMFLLLLQHTFFILKLMLTRSSDLAPGIICSRFFSKNQNKS